MQAKAVVFPAPNEVEFRSVDCPEPGPGDVVVRVTHSWISNGTEGSFLRGERIAGDTAYRPGDPWPFPIVAGYQKIGEAEWVGEAVTDIAVGETVFAAMGKVNGMYQAYAGQISPSVSPREHIWKLPAQVDALAFSGLVLTQVGYNCGVRAPIEAAPSSSATMVGWVADAGRRECRAGGPPRLPPQAFWAGATRSAPDRLAGGALLPTYRVAVDTVGHRRAQYAYDGELATWFPPVWRRRLLSLQLMR